MSFAISGTHVEKVFGKRAAAVHALKGVSLDIKQGELFFLLGGSGCGKTTFLRCIAGLEKPTKGRILFHGEDVTDLPAHKREAAMVFQSYALWPHLTVGENVAFGLEERRIPKREVAQRVEEALEMVGLGGFEKRGIDQMSGGQQQRVSLARALVVKPKCLLLDEPLSNLDAALRLKMRAEIRRIVKENNLTGVYVTHDQSEALSMADRLAVMDMGEIVQVGTPDDVYRNPRSSYVAGFIGETNLLKGVVKEGRRLDADEVVVETWAGTLTGRLTDSEWNPKPETEVIVSVRPEAFRVVHTFEEGCVLRAKVCESTYLGSVIQYGMELLGGIGDGPLIQVAEGNPRGIREPGETEVKLAVDAQDVVILQS